MQVCDVVMSWDSRKKPKDLTVPTTYKECSEPPIDIIPVNDIQIESSPKTAFKGIVDDYQFDVTNIKNIRYNYSTFSTSAGTSTDTLRVFTQPSAFSQWAQDVHGNEAVYDDVTQSWKQTIWAKPLMVPSKIKCTHIPKGFRVSPTINCSECQKLEDSIDTASQLALKQNKEMNLQVQRQTYKVWDCFHMLDDESDKIVKNYCDACKCRNDTNVGLG